LPSPLAGEGGEAKPSPGEGFDQLPSSGPAGHLLPQGEKGRKEAAAWREAPWPEADFIIGNPPFLGASRMLKEYPQEYVDALRRIYADRVPGFSDLVCWWFAKSTDAIIKQPHTRTGLVATNSIRGGTNRAVLDRIARELTIFDAKSDEPWINNGAAVRVSLICFARTDEQRWLNGEEVVVIPSSLQQQSDVLISTKKLKENKNVSFLGVKKGGKFELRSQDARAMLVAPLNVNGKSNSVVLRPRLAGGDLVRRSNEEWIVDFGERMPEHEAMLFEGPYKYVRETVMPYRIKNRREHRATNWWLYSEVSPGMRKATEQLVRHIATPRVSKHRIFVFISPAELLDDGCIAIARDDDTSFGILHSRFHEAWSLRLGTFLGVGNDPRYTPTTTFETFPFPEGLTPDIKAAEYAADPRAIRIAEAAKRLDELRRAWLHPADLGAWVPEITPTAAPGEAPRRYPDRFQPRDAAAAAKLRERTLTRLYNERPQWLAGAHEALDRAVAASYGWPEDIGIEEALARLLALNLERAAAGR
jgi:type II restriction/modification system DNA methylase subunit YeeA